MSKQQTYPRGNAGSCLCGEELAFNKAQVYCWVGALSVGKPWEAESQFSVISILSPTSTWLLSEGSWHTSQEDFCLSFFSSSFTVCLASDPDSLTFCQLHFPLSFFWSSFRSEPLYFFSLEGAKLSLKCRPYNESCKDFCFTSCFCLRNI